MRDTIISIFKAITTGAMRRFRTEELFFGVSAISTVLINYNSVVPALAVLCLLAFYYLFFGWYLFSTLNGKYLLFSIAAGMIYSICLLIMAVVIVGQDSYNGFFYVIQLICLIGLGCYLFKKDWGMYRSNHYIRIAIIVLLNLFVLLFR